MPGGQKTTGTQQLLTLLASKWTIPVIYALQHDTLRYSAIEKALPNITQRVLTTCKTHLGQSAQKYGIIIAPLAITAHGRGTRKKMERDGIVSDANA
ncbi:MAG: winged helix-turn-helix transcriptional regulator [Ktedonobacteraceae bacterium]